MDTLLPHPPPSGLALIGALCGLLGVCATLAVTLWRGRRADALAAEATAAKLEEDRRLERQAVLDHLRELLKLEGERRDAAEARVEAARDDLAEARKAFYEERSNSGAARTLLLEEQRLRSACEREREALTARLSALEAEVGRLRQEHDTLHLVVDELRTDLRELRGNIRDCVDGCDHRPACGLLHAAA